jgi:hypothetical protein
MAKQTMTDATRAGALAQQIVAILVDEDQATCERALQAAMMLVGRTIPQSISRPEFINHDGAGDSAIPAAFFERDGRMKPADNARLCAAYHYSVYGAVPFSVSELGAIASDAGVIVPDRVDMTLRNATHKGKKLFQQTGVGLFKPTAAACMHFAEKWNVKPGNRAKPLASGKDGNGAKT